MHLAIIFCAGAIALGGCATSSTTPSSEPGSATAPHAERPGATLMVKGMSCPNCATNIDKQLIALPGVTSARVNLGTGEVFVSFSAFEEAPSDDDLRRAIVDSGYTLDSIERH